MNLEWPLPPVIQLALPSQADRIAAIYAPFCSETPVSFEVIAPTPEEMAQRIRTTTKRLPWLVLEDFEIAGYAYASPHRERAAYQWAVDVTVYVAPDFRRRGVGRALYTSLFQILVLQGYFKAYAGITLPNPASVGLHEALGFQLVGVYPKVGYKLGAWHDVAWYQKTLQPEIVPPDPPRPIYDVYFTFEMTDALGAGKAFYRQKGPGGPP